MAEVLQSYDALLRRDGGATYAARACGREVDGGRWEGWLEFLPDDGSPVLRSQRETTQPNRTDLAYWAGGLTAVYLEGSLRRVLEPREPAPPPVEERPAYDAPAPPRPPQARRAAVLDPFALAARNPHQLEQELGALATHHLRDIVRFHGLVPDDGDDAAELSRAGLIALILRRVRERREAAAAP